MDSLSEKLTELISQIQYMGGLESRLAEHLIANDVVPVVRCKDCKHYIEDTLTCIPRLTLAFEHPNYYQDDFCSYGERKDK